LPTDVRLPIERSLTGFESGDVKSASGSTLETGAIQEDARSIDSSGHGFTGLGFLEETLALRSLLELPVLFGESHDVFDDVRNVVLIDEVGAEGTATMVQFGGGFVENAETTLSEDALPRRTHECGVEDPGPLFLGILERNHLMEILVSPRQSSNRNALGRSSDRFVRSRWSLGTRRG
jgi:hypothetical protein